MVVKQIIVLCIHFTAVALLLHTCREIFPSSISYYYTWCAEFILYIFFAFVTYDFSKNLFYNKRIKPDNKAVLITGCDSGFGNMAAKRLDSRGFHVFATCLFPNGEGAADLKQGCSDRLHILHMDVTKQESVDKAFSYVKQNLKQNVLWAIVNNAGISKGFGMDFTSIEDVKDRMEVNAFGQFRVTKAFLPLLKKSKGRVVNITSLAARLSLPGLCAYTMSKRAAIGFTESLNQDMHHWGVCAISIEPELFRTPLSCEENVAKQFENQIKKVDIAILNSYGEEYQEKMKDISLMLSRMGSTNAEPVVHEIELALTQKFPKHVYKPRRNMLTTFLFYFLEHLPFTVYESWIFLMLKLFGSPHPIGLENDTHTVE